MDASDDDPELLGILRGFIFGDVFDTGVLDDQTRELITVTVLVCLQALPQLKSHDGGRRRHPDPASLSLDPPMRVVV